MELFALHAQVCGVSHSAVLKSDGFAAELELSGSTRRVGGVDEAIRLARDHIGQQLSAARKQGIPWGLLVAVDGNQAAYGEWPRFSRPIDSPAPPSLSLLTRIRRRVDGTEPIGSLENAVEIIKAYMPRRQHRRAA